ncbi:MAG: phosphoglycerate kinase [Candidatus Baltobacteraceae bacterium]
MQFKTLRDFDVRGKRVLLREDLNVPMTGSAVADLTRIDAALPTLRYLHENGARTIVLSHLGRPDGKPNPKYSLRPVAEALSKRLGHPVQFAADCVGPQAEQAEQTLSDGDIVLLENVRFHPGEEQNDPGFAKQLASLGDLYVNDAFGAAHRAHASTEGIAHRLPAAAGFLMESELHALAELITNPETPVVCVIGGAKVKDKVGVFKNLMDRVEAFCIGGGMANTFLAAQGKDVGTSLRDDDLAPAKSILSLAAERNVALHLPTDVVAAPAFDADDQAKNIPLSEIDHLMILDIGTNSAQQYARIIEDARTIVFNGPMGVYEKKAYQGGTKVVGEAIARATRKGAKSIVGGGDAAAAAHELGFADAMTHVSTGGGATLEFLEGKTLPGVAALMARVPT